MEIKLRTVSTSDLSHKEKEEIVYWHSTSSNSLFYSMKKKIAADTYKQIGYLINQKEDNVRLTVTFSEHLNARFENWSDTEFSIVLSSMRNIVNDSDLKDVLVEYSMNEIGFKFYFENHKKEQELNKIGNKILDEVVLNKRLLHNVNGIRKNIEKVSDSNIVNIVFDITKKSKVENRSERNVVGVREYEA